MYCMYIPCDRAYVWVWESTFHWAWPCVGNDHTYKQCTFIACKLQVLVATGMDNSWQYSRAWIICFGLPMWLLSWRVLCWFIRALAPSLSLFHGSNDQLLARSYFSLILWRYSCFTFPFCRLLYSKRFVYLSVSFYTHFLHLYKSVESLR